jgi:integrase/ribosome-binding protein aMBF1 (putative translation factor)
MQSQYVAATAEALVEPVIPTVDDAPLLADEVMPDWPTASQRHDVRTQEWTSQLIRDGLPFPCHPSRASRNRPSLKACAREAGVPLSYLNDTNSFGRQLIDLLVTEIGVAPRPLDRAIQDLPLGGFRDKACRILERELKTAGKTEDGIRAALDNFKTALNYAAGPDRELSAIPAREALDAARARLWQEKPKGAKNLKADLNHALRIHDELRNDVPPADFAGRLRYAMERVGVKPYQVAKIMKVSRSTVTHWLAGDCCPDASRTKQFHQLEKVLGLQKDELVNLLIPRRNGIGIGRIPWSHYPEHIRAKPWLHAKVKRNLPSNYFILGEPARQEAMASAVAVLSAPRSPERENRAKNRKDAYILKEWTPALKVEFDNLSSVFKSEQMNTTDSAQSPLTWKIVTRDDYWDPRWRRFFGALNSGRICENGVVLQIPREHLTFALLLVVPSLLRHYLLFKQRRNQANKPKLYLTRNDLAWVYFAKSLCHPTDGWLKDNPHMGLRLQPIPGFLDQAQIDEIQNDWVKACERAHNEYAKIIRERRKSVTVGIDSKKPVEPILWKTNPLNALKTIVTGLRSQLGAPDTIATATIQRRIVMVCLLSQLALRRNTMCQIKVGHHLFKDERGWFIKMPVERFKNYKSAHWGSKESTRFFYRRVKDRWGFYAILEQYLATGRRLLLSGAKSDALFVGSRGGAHLTPGRLGDDFRNLTEEFLVCNEKTGSGIPGVVAFGPHLVRHILATAVLKSTNGDYQAAADAIHDTIQTVKKYYAEYLPGDRVERLDNALDKVLEDE